MADALERLQAALAGRYRIERELGSGGMARVYLAVDLKHRCQVAIKVLKPEIAAGVGPERFMREIEIHARLSHPHILPLHDSGLNEGLPYFVTAFAEGASLRDRLERERQLPIRDAIRIAIDVARALEFAHQRGVVHRDIKPDNILLQDGEAVVADFGIARTVMALGGSRLTETGVVVGTVPYMSPEQSAGDGVDERTDVYALACVLYEMVAGQTPYTGPTPASVTYQHLNAPVPDVRQLRPSVPDGLRGVLEQALAKTPADRYPRASAMRAALEEVLRSIESGTREAIVRTVPMASVSPPADPGATPKSRPFLPRLRSRGLVLATLAVVVAAIVTVKWKRGCGGGHTPVEPTAIAVLPFSVYSNRDDGYLSEGMVDLLATTLDGAADLRSVDPHALIVYCDQHGLKEPGPGDVRGVASRFGAGLIAWGSVHRNGDRMLLTATLISSGKPDAPLALEKVEGPASDIQGLVDQLAIRLIAAHTGGKPEFGSASISLAEQTTRSADGLKSFLEGEQLLRKRDYAEAAAAYERAVRHDSTFALAWQRLSFAEIWDGNFAAGNRAMAHAELHLDRLPERERQRMEAIFRSVTGDFRHSIEIFRGIVARHPDDADAWYRLGEFQYHGNQFLGRSPFEARAALSRALDLDPGYAHGMTHLVEMAGSEGDLAAMDSLLILDLRDAPQDSLHYLTMRAFLAGDREEQVRMLKRLRGIYAQQVFAFRDVGARLHDLEGAEEIAREFVADHPGRLDKGYNQARTLAAVLQAQGRWHEAIELIRRAGATDSVVGAWYGALASATTPFPLSTTDVATARRILAALRRPMARDTMAGAASWYGSRRVRSMEPAVRAYLEGLLDSRLGDAQAALQSAARLDTMKLPDEAMDMPADFAATLRALVAYRNGDPAEACRLMEAAPLRYWFFSASDPFRKRTHSRFLRAELLRAAGRHEDALGWYAGLIRAEVEDVLPYLPGAYLGSARSLEALGRNAEAIRHYRKFIDMWKRCDPELQPMVDDAKTRLARLTAGSG